MTETKKKIELSLINDLCTIMNTESPTSPDTVLALFFLDHYHSISNLSVYDIAERCGVSRSSIHRFCQRLGYHNFKDMKADFFEMSTQYDYFMQFARRDDYITYIQFEIIKMIVEFKELFTDEKLNELATRIHDSKEVVFISSYSEKSYLQKMQRPLILSGEIIRIFTDHFEENDLQYSFLKKLDKDSLVIVVSAKGIYASLMNDYIKTIPAHKVLITSSGRTDLNETYNEIYRLSKEDYTNQKSVYSEYGLALFLDMLYSTYLRKYGTL